MQKVVRWSSWPLILALALPAFAADEKKDAKKKKDEDGKDKDKKAEKLATSGSFIAKVVSVSPNSDKMFKVQISYMVPNPGAQANLIRRQMDLQRAMLNRNPIQRQQQVLQALQGIRQEQANMYKEEKKDVELRAADEIRVRTAKPPLDYDDKGHVKKYTAKELKELKGTENLPGYTADFDALRAGQVVKVYLAKKKETAAKKKPKKGKGKKAKAKKKDKDKDDDDDEDGDEDLRDAKPEVAMVVILVEPKITE